MNVDKTKSVCKLCGKSKFILKSHIIPKFVNQYLVKTSITGYLRQGGNINKRVQDGIKVELLCQDCELKFSKWERQFAQYVFIPHNNLNGSGRALVKIVYDSSLVSFVISLFWRVLVATQISDNFESDTLKLANRLVEEWTEFLNGKRKDWGDCEFHLVLLDYVDENYLPNLPSYFDFYLFGLWDVSAYDTKDGRAGIYIKLPGMLLLCNILPSHLDTQETKIESLGTLYPEKIQDKTNTIGSILIARSIAIEEELKKISPTQYKKMTDEIKAALLKRTI